MRKATLLCMFCASERRGIVKGTARTGYMALWSNALICQPFRGSIALVPPEIGEHLHKVFARLLSYNF